tara:strand:- start:829 stop:1149 length:321 start_codon:yes stop_codon:yes gene_type:complete
MTRDLEAKLAKLAEFEAIEAKKERWKPYRELNSRLSEVYDHQRTIEDAAHHAEEATDACRDLDMEYYVHNASDELWDAQSRVSIMIDEMETELEALEQKLAEEEEE